MNVPYTVTEKQSKTNYESHTKLLENCDKQKFLVKAGLSVVTIFSLINHDRHRRRPALHVFEYSREFYGFESDIFY